MMLLNGKEELKSEVYVDGIRLVHVSKFKYLGYESSTANAECCRKVARRRAAGAIRSLVNFRDFQLIVLESYMKHCLCLFLCMAVRQCYGRRDLE